MSMLQNHNLNLDIKYIDNVLITESWWGWWGMLLNGRSQDMSLITAISLSNMIVSYGTQNLFYLMIID